MRTLSKTKLQYLTSLSQKKVRDREGVFLIEGWRSLEEASHFLKEIEFLIYTRRAIQDARAASVISSARKLSRGHAEITEAQFSAIADTVTGQGVAAAVKKLTPNRIEMTEQLRNRNVAFVVALDGIGDPGNLGSIIRTCDWFGTDTVFLGPGCVDLYNPKVVRSTVGSVFHLRIIDLSDSSDLFQNTLMALRSEGFSLYGAEVRGSSPLQSIVWAEKSVLVIGSEARGLSSEVLDLVDHHVAIPRYGKAESLNAGVAAGVLLAHRSFQKNVRSAPQMMPES